MIKNRYLSLSNKYFFLFKKSLRYFYVSLAVEIDPKNSIQVK